MKYGLLYLSYFKRYRVRNKPYMKQSKCIKYIPDMIDFKHFPYKVLLTLGLGLVSTFAWSQEESAAQVIVLEEKPEQIEHQEGEAIDQQEINQNTLSESSTNINVDLVPIIFDPVLIQTIELNETDDNGDPRLDTIELSPLPSAINSSPQISVDNSQLDRRLIDSSLTQFQESILEFELDGGVYDFRLSELYLSLGNTHQQVGDYQLAIDAYNEALQLSRINDGLFTEDQVPIVEALVDSYLNLGDIASANLNQEYLLYIKQKIYGAGHPIILDELLEYADWNLHASGLSMGYLPNLQYLHFRTESFNELNYNNSVATEDLLSAAAFAYTQALIMQHDLEEEFNENPFSDDTIDLKNSLDFPDEDYDISATEQKLAYTYFLQYQFDQNNLAVNAFGEAPTTNFLDSYTDGRAALERRYAYLQSTNSPTINIIQALVDIADWYLVFERWSTAEELYLQAFELMEGNGIDKLNGLEYPDLPIHIPSFLSSPYTRASIGISSDEVLEYEGYIDISFSLSRSAKPIRIRFVDSSEGTTEETERALLNKIRYSKYRLQLKDRSEYAENSYLVRYYFTAQAEPPAVEE